MISYFVKRNSCYSIIALIIVLCNSPAFSQLSKQEKTAMETLASDYFRKGQYHIALPIYLELDSLYKDSKYDYPVGVCYINDFDNTAALPYFLKCFQKSEEFPARLYFYTAKAYHLSHQLDEAIKYYTEYKTKLKPKKDAALIKKIDREIEMCNNGKELMAYPLKIEIKNMGGIINSPYPDYAPVLSADQQTLIFTSNRPNTTGGQIDESDGLYYEDIYISNRDTSNNWSVPAKISDNINSNGHDASIALTADGQKLIFYRYLKENPIFASSGDLYISELHGNQWENPLKFPEQINTAGWEPSACFSEDERTLYFSSDREGGYGGTDIWRVKKLPNGAWALPQNMGPAINSPYDEDSPFMHPDGKTLYFSSMGHKCMGGYDVFSSEYSDSLKKWSNARNIGYPISTAHDDIHFTWSADANTAFFSSYRAHDGYGGKDIYYANIQKEAAFVYVMKGLILDSITHKPIEATIKVTDGDTNEVVGVFNSNSATGKYIIILPEGKNYTFSIIAPNYGLCSEMIKLENLKQYKEVTKDISLCPGRFDK